MRSAQGFCGRWLGDIGKRIIQRGVRGDGGITALRGYVILAIFSAFVQVVHGGFLSLSLLFNTYKLRGWNRSLKQ